jgi:hypothetical protein
MTRLRMVAPLAMTLTCLGAPGCGDSPTSPTPATQSAPTPTVVSLAVSTDSVSLARYGTTQVSATVTRSDGSREDVTGKATWSSSNPEIAVAQAGFVVGASLGAARLSVGYGGLITSLDVSVRRATVLGGSLGLEVTSRAGLIRRMTTMLDGVVIAECQYPQANFFCQTAFGSVSLGTATLIDPGPHQLTARVELVDGVGSVSVRTYGSLRLVDRDTQEMLAWLPMDPKTLVVSSGTTLTWPLDVRAYQ